MKIEQYITETGKLKEFIEFYCNKKHINQKKSILKDEYRENRVENIELLLCEDCLDMFLYAKERLSLCEHEPKPKCRKCKTICYDKERYSKLGRIMRFSAVRLKIKKVLKLS